MTEVAEWILIWCESGACATYVPLDLEGQNPGMGRVSNGFSRSRRQLCGTCETCLLTPDEILCEFDNEQVLRLHAQNVRRDVYLCDGDLDLMSATTSLPIVQYHLHRARLSSIAGPARSPPARVPRMAVTAATVPRGPCPDPACQPCGSGCCLNISRFCDVSAKRHDLVPVICSGYDRVW